jgi:hypothetical protein
MLNSRLLTNGDGSGFYSLGGWQSAITTSEVPSNDNMWKFVIDKDDPSTGTWRAEDLAVDSASPLQRTNENSIVCSKNKIFDLGGSAGSSSDPSGALWKPNPLLRIFDLEGKKWSTLPTPWGSSAITNAAAAYSEKWGDVGIIVVIGGQLVSRTGTGLAGPSRIPALARCAYTTRPRTSGSRRRRRVTSRRQGMCIVSQYSVSGSLEMYASPLP